MNQNRGVQRYVPVKRSIIPGYIEIGKRRKSRFFVIKKCILLKTITNKIIQKEKYTQPPCISISKKKLCGYPPKSTLDLNNPPPINK